MAPMVLDFTNPQIAPMLPAGFPDELRTRLTVNVDQWDGFPIARQQLLGALAQAGKAFQSIAETGTASFEVEFLRKDGAIFPAVIGKPEKVVIGFQGAVQKPTILTDPWQR